MPYQVVVRLGISSHIKAKQGLSSRPNQAESETALLPLLGAPQEKQATQL